MPHTYQNDTCQKHCMNDVIPQGPWIFGLMTLAAAAVYFMLSITANVWVDEVYTLGVMTKTLKEGFWFIIQEDVHPPLYYAGLKAWSIVFQEYFLSYRWFSIVPVLLMGLLGAYPVQKLLGRQTALWWTAFMLFSPFSFYYALDLRMYSWACFFVSTALIYAFMTLKYRATLSWIFFVLASCCGIFIHYYAALGIGLIWLFFTVSFLFSGYRYKRRDYILFYLGGCAVFFMAMMLMIVFYHQYHMQMDASWIRPSHVIKAIGLIFFFAPDHEVFSVFMWGLFLVGFYHVIRNPQTISKKMVMTAGFCVMISLMIGLGISFILKPLYVERYFLPFAGCFFLPICVILSRSRLLGWIGAGLYIMVILSCLSYTNDRVMDKGQEQMRQMILSRQKDGLFLYTSVETRNFLYYHTPFLKIHEFIMPYRHLNDASRRNIQSLFAGQSVYFFTLKKLNDHSQCIYDKYAGLTYCLTPL